MYLYCIFFTLSGLFNCSGELVYYNRMNCGTIFYRSCVLKTPKVLSNLEMPF